ncbi:hypothetical protein [Sandaracinus amylolyticus]|uniref:Uncharacterized protein n=1 Tax=Sandaracinus amylolyticus TaxID=927083 RepID=A0A0F6W349_9BACT|nr:hypothetical protein [Sandaracinus amylolyticus]AKF06065.1 hypothetical protein DB32_003214 [Sandaracinus amylolyticus]
MTWFKVDDGFTDHPKVDALLEGKHAEVALALWTLAGCWCAKQLTDGFVPAGRIRRFGLKSPDAAAAELVRVGLWVVVPEGFQFHQWTEHQPSREDVLAERDRKARNKRDSRARKRGDQPSASTGESPGASPVTKPPVTDDKPVSHHVPTRPDPSRPDHDLDRDVVGDPVEPERGPTPAGIVEAAYASAVGEAHGRYVANPSRDVRFWRSAIVGVQALSKSGEPLRDAAIRLAREYVAERNTRSPEYFAEWLQKRAATAPGSVTPIGPRPPSAPEKFRTMDDAEAARRMGVTGG